MFVSEKDSEIIRSKQVRVMLEQYEKNFGERFPYFNYADFPGNAAKLAAQEYVEILENALKTNKPYKAKSFQDEDEVMLGR